MKKSLKQLLHTPMKVLLFFFLTAGATALLVVGSALYLQSSRRIAEVEGNFTTLAMVEQVPIKTVPKVYSAGPCGLRQTTGWEEIWGEADSIDVLDFEGAKCLTVPENRPYYITEIPALTHSSDVVLRTNRHVIQVVALEDSDPQTTTARVQVEKVIATFDDEAASLYNNVTSTMKEGKEIIVCQCDSEEEFVTPMQKGKSYILSPLGLYCVEHEKWMKDDGLDTREYIVYFGPYCEQYDKDANELPTSYFTHNTKSGLVEEVTEDFWEPGGKGEAWEYWASYQEKGNHLFTVAPVDDLQLLPAFQNHKAHLAQGREITAEEFENGALVCMIPDSVFAIADLKLGDKISFSMLNSVYGAPPDTAYVSLWARVSSFNAQGEFYEPFWETEYEVVGTYSVVGLAGALDKGMIANDMIVLPAKSVGVSDENNISYYGTIKPAQATFLLPNGSIDAFETALHEAVPDLQGLEITYNDNGYEEIMGSLRSAWITAILLLAVGLFSTLATLLLLLYFFIIKQKKRTAIERSLGMSKRQCRVSILSGILVLTILSSAVGCAGAALLMNWVDLTGSANAVATEKSAESEFPVEEIEAEAEEESPVEPTETFAEFSTKFSLWASESNMVDYYSSDAASPIALFFVIPLALFVLVFALSLLLVNRNLKIEPIYLLSGKIE